MALSPEPLALCTCSPPETLLVRATASVGAGWLTNCSRTRYPASEAAVTVQLPAGLLGGPGDARVRGGLFDKLFPTAIPGLGPGCRRPLAGEAAGRSGSRRRTKGQRRRS